MANELKQLGVQVDAALYAAIMAEAKDRAVSMAAVIRWALMERYERQVQDWRAAAEAEEVPASP